MPLLGLGSSSGFGSLLSPYSPSVAGTAAGGAAHFLSAPHVNPFHASPLLPQNGGGASGVAGGTASSLLNWPTHAAANGPLLGSTNPAPTLDPLTHSPTQRVSSGGSAFQLLSSPVVAQVLPMPPGSGSNSGGPFNKPMPSSSPTFPTPMEFMSASPPVPLQAPIAFYTTVGQIKLESVALAAPGRSKLQQVEAARLHALSTQQGTMEVLPTSVSPTSSLISPPSMSDSRGTALSCTVSSAGSSSCGSTSNAAHAHVNGFHSQFEHGARKSSGDVSVGSTNGQTPSPSSEQHSSEASPRLEPTPEGDEEAQTPVQQDRSPRAQAIRVSARKRAKHSVDATPGTPLHSAAHPPGCSYSTPSTLRSLGSDHVPMSRSATSMSHVHHGRVSSLSSEASPRHGAIRAPPAHARQGGSTSASLPSLSGGLDDRSSAVSSPAIRGLSISSPKSFALSGPPSVRTQLSRSSHSGAAAAAAGSLPRKVSISSIGSSAASEEATGSMSPSELYAAGLPLPIPTNGVITGIGNGGAAGVTIPKPVPGKRGGGFSCHCCKTTKKNIDELFLCTNFLSKDPHSPASVAAAKAANEAAHQRSLAGTGCVLLEGDGDPLGAAYKRCRKKYCIACMKRLYTREFMTLRGRNADEWSCPSCLNRCTCAGCERKVAGQSEAPWRTKGAKKNKQQQGDVISPTNASHASSAKKKGAAHRRDGSLDAAVPSPHSKPGLQRKRSRTGVVKSESVGDDDEDYLPSGSDARRRLKPVAPRAARDEEEDDEEQEQDDDEDEEDDEDAVDEEGVMDETERDAVSGGAFARDSRTQRYQQHLSHASATYGAPSEFVSDEALFDNSYPAGGSSAQEVTSRAFQLPVTPDASLLSQTAQGVDYSAAYPTSHQQLRHLQAYAASGTASSLRHAPPAGQPAYAPPAPVSAHHRRAGSESQQMGAGLMQMQLSTPDGSDSGCHDRVVGLDMPPVSAPSAGGGAGAGGAPSAAPFYFPPDASEAELEALLLEKHRHLQEQQRMTNLLLQQIQSQKAQHKLLQRQAQQQAQQQHVLQQQLQQGSQLSVSGSAPPMSLQEQQQHAMWMMRQQQLASQQRQQQQL